MAYAWQTLGVPSVVPFGFCGSGRNFLGMGWVPPRNVLRWSCGNGGSRQSKPL